MKRIFILSLSILLIAVPSCKKDKREAKKTDKSLYAELGEAGYTYYQNGSILSAAAPSPHGSFKLRFNSVATSVLDSTGELPTGGVFPTGSVIVKEVYSGTNINLYAVMKKDPSNINAKNGWLWAEYKTNGDASYSVYEKGNACIGCHSGALNRDLVRTFDLH